MPPSRIKLLALGVWVASGGKRESCTERREKKRSSLHPNQPGCVFSLRPQKKLARRRKKKFTFLSLSVSLHSLWDFSWLPSTSLFTVEPSSGCWVEAWQPCPETKKKGKLLRDKRRERGENPGNPVGGGRERGGQDIDEELVTWKRRRRRRKSWCIAECAISALLCMTRILDFGVLYGGRGGEGGSHIQEPLGTGREEVER